MNSSRHWDIGIITASRLILPVFVNNASAAILPLEHPDVIGDEALFTFFAAGHS